MGGGRMVELHGVVEVDDIAHKSRLSKWITINKTHLPINARILHATYIKNAEMRRYMIMISNMKIYCPQTELIFFQHTCAWNGSVQV